MSKKTYKMTRQEQLDTFVPIFCVSWVLVFTYISAFIPSKTLALFTVMPIFFLYALYSAGSAYYSYKEVEFLKAFGKDYREAELRRRKKAPKLNIPKLVIAGVCLIAGVLLCIFL